MPPGTIIPNALTHPGVTATIFAGGHEMQGLAGKTQVVAHRGASAHAIALGADAIITNYPDRLRTLLGVGPRYV